MEENNKWTPIQKLIQSIEADITRGHISAQDIANILVNEYEVPEKEIPCPRTIQRWRKLPGWNDTIWKEYFEEFKGQLKLVLKTAMNKAIDGDHNWGKLVFSVFDKFPSKRLDLSPSDQWKSLFSDCLVEKPEDSNDS